MKWLSALSAHTQIETAPHKNAFKGIDGTLELKGPLAEVSLDFSYENTGDDDLELHLIFPLAADAVLLGVDLEINDEVLLGKILPADTAEQDYEDAISEGNTPVLIERLPENQIRMQLGNLMPEEKAVVTLRYAQWVSPKSGECKFTLPTTIAPRFGSQPISHGLPQLATQDALVAYPISLYVKSNIEHHRDLTCPSGHNLTALANPDIEYNYRLPDLGEYCFCGLMNRDLVITWQSPSTIGQALIASPEHPSDHAALLAQFELPISTDLRQQSNPVTLKLLIDCSGSMAGDSMVAAREGALHALTQLRDEEHFAVSLFGSSVEPMTQGLQVWSSKNRASWRRALANVDATLGGTEMELALKHCLAMGDANLESSGSDILLITDGQVTHIDAMVKKLSKAKHRLFAIGVGHAPAETQLAALALASGGECLLVSPGEDLRVNIERLMSRMRAAQVRDLQVLLADNEAHWLADLPQRAPANGVFQLYGLLNRSSWNGQLIVSGNIQGKNQLWRVKLPTQNTTSAAASTLVHYQRVTTLPAKQQAAYAQNYGLLTKHTRLLCIYERSENKKAGSMPVLDDIPHMTHLTMTRMRLSPSASYDECFMEMSFSPMALPQYLELNIAKRERHSAPRGTHAETPSALISWLSAAPSLEVLCERVTHMEMEGLPEAFRNVLCVADDERRGQLILAWLTWLFDKHMPPQFERLLHEWESVYELASPRRLMNALTRLQKQLPTGPWLTEFNSRLKH